MWIAQVREEYIEKKRKYFSYPNNNFHFACRLAKTKVLLKYKFSLLDSDLFYIRTVHTVWCTRYVS